MITERDLLAKKKEIEEAKKALAELQGEEKALLKNLKETYNCSSLEEAKTLLEKKDVELSTLEKERDTLLEEIEEKYF